MDAIKIVEIWHVPKSVRMVALRADGEYVVSYGLGWWFTRERLVQNMEDAQEKPKDREKTLAGFDEAVAACKASHTVISGANGPVSIAH